MGCDPAAHAVYSFQVGSHHTLVQRSITAQPTSLEQFLAALSLPLPPNNPGASSQRGRRGYSLRPHATRHSTVGAFDGHLFMVLLGRCSRVSFCPRWINRHCTYWNASPACHRQWVKRLNEIQRVSFRVSDLPRAFSNPKAIKTHFIPSITTTTCVFSASWPLSSSRQTAPTLNNEHSIPQQGTLPRHPKILPHSKLRAPQFHP
ncbi:hypothetical protein BJ741DRAFT_215900 [Chytriomyces cf. hyalinus JEL632]|nr:hypothetical protein BJ741DRAFT_215900 [Chytriomyces cf. hyalinus JEL632]